MGRDICILVGSIRDDSYSLKIAGILAAKLAANGHRPTIVDPRILKLGIPHHPDERNTGEVSSSLQQLIVASTSVIFITPEYDGSYSAVSKILVEHLGYPSALCGKPVSIVGVATGRIGAHRAIEHLRAVLLHIGAIVYPPCLSFAEVHKHFTNTGTPDPKLEQILSQHAADFAAFF